MSMIRCEDCRAIIDSDDDPDCFVSFQRTAEDEHTTVRCQACRIHRGDPAGNHDNAGS